MKYLLILTLALLSGCGTVVSSQIILTCSDKCDKNNGLNFLVLFSENNFACHCGDGAQFSVTK